jgi:hypothetical protein
MCLHSMHTYTSAHTLKRTFVDVNAGAYAASALGERIENLDETILPRSELL